MNIPREVSLSDEAIKEGDNYRNELPKGWDQVLRWIN